MDGTRFLSRSAARRGEILFNGSHMLNGFFLKQWARCNRGKSSRYAGLPVLLKSLFPSLGIRAEINRLRAGASERRREKERGT